MLSEDFFQQTRKASAAARKRFQADVDSSDESDGSDWDDAGNSSKKAAEKNAKRSRGGKGAMKKKRKVGVSDISDSNDSSNDDSSASSVLSSSSESNSDGERSDADEWDDMLMGDAEDRRKMAAMTEKEREQVLYERGLKRQELTERKDLRRQLRQQRYLQKSAEEKKKSKTKTSGVVKIQRSTSRRGAKLAIDERKEAISSLQARRTAKTKGSFWSDDDEDNDDDDTVGRKTTTRAEDKAPWHDGSDNEGTVSSVAGKSDCVSRKEAEPEPTIDLVLMNKIRLSRNRISLWMNESYFEEVVTGCFVRVSIGNNMLTHETTYRAAQIVEVIEKEKIYTINGTQRTNKYLRCRIGKDERTLSIQFVSNDDISEHEYDRYLAIQAAASEPIMTIAEQREKRERLNRAYIHVRDAQEVEEIVQKKNKLLSRPRNFAHYKRELKLQIETARNDGNDAKVIELEESLSEHENKAQQVRDEKLKVGMAVENLNKRNRGQNKGKEDLFQKERKEMLDKSMKNPGNANLNVLVNDPFTRRRCMPLLVIKESGKKKTTETDDEETGERKDKEANNEEATLPQTPQSARGGPSTTDLFSKHDFDIDIDIQLDDIGSSLTKVQKDKPPSSSMDQKVGGLAAYKRSLGLL